MAMIDATAPAPEQNPSQIHIDLRKDDMKQMLGIEAKDAVQVQLTGRVVSFTQREAMDPAEDGVVGSLTLEVDKFNIAADESGTFQELMD